MHRSAHGVHLRSALRADAGRTVHEYTTTSTFRTAEVRDYGGILEESWGRLRLANHSTSCCAPTVSPTWKTCANPGIAAL